MKPPGSLQGIVWGISERASEVLREVDYAISAMWLLKQSMISHIGLLMKNLLCT